MDGKVMTWSKNSSFKKSKLIGQRKGYLYELNIEPIQALIHELADINKMWHRRLGSKLQSLIDYGEDGY